MALEIPGFKLGIEEAASDLSGNQFYACKITSSGVELAGAGDPIDGILQNKPMLGNAAELTVNGVSKAVAGAAIAKGALVASNGAGKLVTAASGNNIAGKCLEAVGADDELTTVHLMSLGYLP